MILGVAVADDHGDVLAAALGAQRSLGEVGSHGEAVHGAVVADGQDGAHLAGGHVDDQDGDVVLLTAVGGQGLLQHVHRLGGGAHDGVVAQVHALEQVGVLLADDQGNHVAGGADALHGLVAAHHAALAGAAQDEHGVAGLHQLGGLGGSAGHVQSGQGQLLAHVVGQLGVQAGLKQDGLSVHLHPVDLGVDGLDLVDLQGGQGQGHQGGDLVAHLQVDLALEILADGLDGADEHAAGAGDGVLHLAALVHDVQNHLLGTGQILLAGLVDLGEGGGVNVQRGHIAQDLVGVDLVHVVVDLLGSLGQQALGLNHAMGAVLVAFLLHSKFLLFRSFWFGWGDLGLFDIWLGRLEQLGYARDRILRASSGVAISRPSSWAMRATLATSSPLEAAFWPLPR